MKTGLPRWRMRRVAPLATSSTPAASPRLMLAIVGVLALSACRSDEERATLHLVRAEERLAEGDVARAEIEYRNALDLAPNDLETRLAFANLLLAEGDRVSAAGHLTRIVEQAPRHGEAQLLLTDMAMQNLDWPGARQHFARATEAGLGGDGMALRQAVLDYVAAATAGDAAGRRAALEQVTALLDADPAFLPANYVVIDGFVRSSAPEEALEALERALVVAPDDLRLTTSRLRLLHQLGRDEEIGPQLQGIVTAHPEQEEFRGMLVAWHVKHDDLDAAEAVLREIPEPNDTDAQVALVRFLEEYRGPEAAGAEIEARLEAAESPNVFRALRATLAFDAGKTDAAISEMREVVADPESGGTLSENRLLLAEMLDAAGDRGGAEQVLETLVSEDPRHVDALTTQAAWLVDRGQSGPAIRMLRTALDIRPDHVKALCALARAHEMEGDAALSMQIKGRAFEASGYAPDQALDYASHLSELGKGQAAIDVLNTSLLQAPEDLRLLARLADSYLEATDIHAAGAIEARMRSLDTGSARHTADRVRIQRLAAQGEIEDARRYLEHTLENEGESVFGYAALIRAHLVAGRTDMARGVAEESLQRHPDQPALRAVMAALLVTQGDYETAAEIYSDLIASTTDPEPLWAKLIELRQAQGDATALSETIEAAVLAVPKSPQLRWLKAGHLAGTGDRKAAIAVYEALLADHPDNAPVRNNLAGLLSESGDTAELARAAEVAAPLEGSPVPYFRDTVGWIRFLQGDLEMAVPALLEAAGKLREDPAVQLRAADALLAADRAEEARSHYRAALRAARGNPAIIEKAQLHLTRLDADAAGSN